MAWRLELESRARKEFLELARDVRVRLADVLDDLQREPRPPGAKKLIGVDGYRFRKGDYRVLYTVDDSAQLVRVYRIGHRRDVYRRR